MLFPIYRKYNHNRTFFKITSDKDFEELNIMGNSYFLKNFEVKIFSDRIFILDMIENKNNLWKEITEEE